MKLLRQKLGHEWYEFSPANTLLLGWIGYMCDCAELLLEALRTKGNRDLGGVWLRSIIETSILMHWVRHDEERAWRVVNAQHKIWERRSKHADGTIFHGPSPPKALRPGKALPSVTQMAQEIGDMETMVFLLESERLHPGAGTALEYVHIADLTQEETAIHLRRPPTGVARESGVLAIALYCLLRSGTLLSERFNLGLKPTFEEIGAKVFVGLEADPSGEGWDALFQDAYDG